MNSSKTLQRILIILAILFLFFSFYSAANASQARGGRPPVVDLSKISEDAMQPGVIRIKLKPEYSAVAKTSGTRKTASGVIHFDIESLDELNRKYEVKKAAPVLTVSKKNAEVAYRQQEWGFHLWVDIHFEAGVDVKEVVRAYEALYETEIAEPVYKIRLIGNVAEDPLPSGSMSGLPDDPGLDSQWHYHNTGQAAGTPGADISLNEAWEIEAGSPDIIVAVVDGGIQYNHPDLSSNMWSGIGYNFVEDSPEVIEHNHGTHVAGTVAAVNNNGKGVSGVAGGTGQGDGVKLMSCQVFTDDASGGFHLAPVFAADNGAAVSQNSWGYTVPGVYNQVVLDAIDYFNEYGGGNVMDGGITIFAAGNDNSSEDWYPAYYSGVLAVAATNNKDQKAWYSNFGQWVDISAPGGETGGNAQGGVLSTTPGSSYGYSQGTSMACPHVSGVAALILSKYPGRFTPEELKELLLNSVDDHYPENLDYTGQLGSGRLNAFKALQMAASYVGGISDPLQLAAVPEGSNQINLSWKRNDSMNNVILAVSEDGNFGSLQDGIAYQQGSHIAGGGIVLYKGPAEYYTHNNLQAGKTYYYKAWSVNQEHHYSGGTAVVGCTTDENIVFRLEVSVMGQGNTSPIPGIYSHPEGESVSLQATPSEGWKFESWIVNGQHIANPAVFLNINRDIQATAIFVEETVVHQVNIVSQGRGKTSPLAGEYFLEEGTEVALQALPSQSWKFSKWVINGVSYYTQRKKVIINGATDIKAVFIEDRTQFSLYIGSIGMGTVSAGEGEHVVEEGETFSAVAYPEEGWEFVRWIINGKEGITEDVLSYVVDGDAEIIALFETTTGVVDDDPLSQIRIFPNPASEYIKIGGTGNLDEVEVEIIDILGRRVFYTPADVTYPAGDNIRIEAGHFPEGLYIVVIRAGEKVWKDKVVISR